MKTNKENSEFMLATDIKFPSGFEDTIAGFEKWLKDVHGNSERTIDSKISNLKKVNAEYGDLYKIWNKDQLMGLLSDFTYTREDEKSQNPQKHKIQISGNIYNSTASYKSAVRLYKIYLETLLGGWRQNRKSHQDIIDEIIKTFDILKSEIRNKDSYKKGEVDEYIAKPLKEKLLSSLQKFGYYVELEQVAGTISNGGTTINSRDRYDIFCDSDNNPRVIIEIDTHRADQVSKKMISRLALNNSEELIYVTLIYPNTHSAKDSEIKECQKYCTYMDLIFSQMMPPYKSFVYYWL